MDMIEKIFDVLIWDEIYFDWDCDRFRRENKKIRVCERIMLVLLRKTRQRRCIPSLDENKS